MQQLMRAAQKNKEVTVVLELGALRRRGQYRLGGKARRCRRASHAGVFGYKTHAKLLMLVRREDDRLRRYVPLGNRHYHPGTTRFYTDFGLLTANDEMGADVAEIFKQLTGLGTASALKHLWQARSRCRQMSSRRSGQRQRSLPQAGRRRSWRR